MAAKKINAQTVAAREFADFRAKGMEFFTVMNFCLQDGEWDAVLLMGVHAAISLNDAFTIFRINKRSAGKSHQDAVILLSQAAGGTTDGRRQADRLSAILNSKHLVEYTGQRFTEREARDFAKQVDRFAAWIQEQLP